MTEMTEPGAHENDYDRDIIIIINCSCSSCSSDD
jgi:hypothetical protein